MLIRLSLLLSLTLASTLVLTGAWTGSFAISARTPDILFVPQSIALDVHVVGSGLDARQLLEKAREKLLPARTPWLKTKIRQTMTDANSTFVAQGYLQRGPNHCLRLEMEVLRKSRPLTPGPSLPEGRGEELRLVVVSDGEMVARVRTLGGRTPVVTLERLTPEDPQANESANNEELLSGPPALLAQIHKHLQNASLQTGLLQEMRVIQIKGDLGPGSTRLGTAMPIRHARVYLDAKTLWPHRLEWWGVDKTNTPQAILRIEFLEPEVDRELTAQECATLFSYRPDRE